MSNGPDETSDEGDPDEAEEGRKPHLNFEDLMETEGGMTLSRMREIEEAEKRGEPLDLSSEERQDYEEGKAEIAEVMESFRRTMTEPYQAISKQLMDIVTRSIQMPKFDLPKMKQPGIPAMRTPFFELPQADLDENADSADPIRNPLVPRLPTYTAPEPIISDEDWEEIAEAIQQRDQRQEQIKDSTFQTAIAMKHMLDEMEREAKRVEQQTKTDTMRWWVGFVVIVVTMILAGIAAVPIVAPFIEYVWGMIFGG